MESPQPSPGEPAVLPEVSEQPGAQFAGADPLAGADLRSRLVASLHANGAVRSPPVEEALLRVPRHLFLPQVPLAQAYADSAVPTHWDDGQPVSSASQPSIVALMLEQLQIAPGMRVLEIGAGTGYNAALLAELAGPTGHVTTIDLDAQIAAEAREHLDSAGYPGVRVLAADGWDGCWDDAPYDRVILTASASDVSPVWFEQLADDGLLVLPLWLRVGEASVALRKRWGQLHSESLQPCGFMRLRGSHGDAVQWAALAGGRRLAGEDARELAGPISALLASRPRHRLWLPPSPALVQCLSLSGLQNVTLWTDRNDRTDAGHLRLPSRPRLGVYVADEGGPSLVLFAVGRPFLLCYGSPPAERALEAELARWRSISVAPMEQWRVVAYPASDSSVPPVPSPTVVRLARRHFVFDVDTSGTGIQ